MIENHMVLPVYEDPEPSEEVNDYLWWEDQFALMVQKQNEEELRQIIKQRTSYLIGWERRISRLSIFQKESRRGHDKI